MINGATPVKDRTVFVKALLYGQAGAGKTRFCADAPNPILFDFESSTETLRHWPEYEHIPVKRPKDVDELRKDIETASQRLKHRNRRHRHNHNQSGLLPQATNGFFCFKAG